MTIDSVSTDRVVFHGYNPHIPIAWQKLHNTGLGLGQLTGHYEFEAVWAG